MSGSPRFGTHRTRSTPPALAVVGLTLVLLGAPTAARGQTVSEVLSFLLLNRSIVTDDFVRDEQAARATRDAITGLLAVELGTLPIAPSAGGFAYRIEPSLGTVIRSSESFGPFLTERSLSSGPGQASLGVSFRSTVFDSMDGRELRNGTLVSTAAILRGEPAPFDVETLSLRIRADTVAFTGTVGVTDRLDLSAAVPFVRVSVRGQRLDTYRGLQTLQATGSATAAGLGDVLIRGKYNVLRAGASGLAVGGELRLPTGDEANLLGVGHESFGPRLIGSFEDGTVGVHGELSYLFTELDNSLGYSAAVAVAAVPRLTIVVELAGRRYEGLGRLIDTTAPHPTLEGVETIRLTGVDGTTDRAVALAGIKWNVAGTWLLTANVLRPITSVGLNANWVPTVTFDYAFGR